MWWQNSLKDGLNYGLYLPESNGRSGKFLDEARPLRDYPLPGPVALLEVSMVYPLTPPGKPFLHDVNGKQ